MKAMLCSVPFILVLLGVSDGFIHNINSQGEGVNSLQAIGGVDGRKWYIETNQSMSWKDARVCCEEAGLELGSITSLSEYVFLKTGLYNYSPGFWTAAREDRTHNGFVWDTNGRKPILSITGEWESGMGEDFGQCGYVQSYGFSMSMKGYPCSEKLLVLCQE